MLACSLANSVLVSASTRPTSASVLTIAGRLNVTSSVDFTSLALVGPFPTLMLVTKSVAGQAATWRAAKREQRVLATGVPAHHSATRTRLIATAVRTCCRRVLARPM